MCVLAAAAVVVLGPRHRVDYHARDQVCMVPAVARGLKKDGFVACRHDFGCGCPFPVAWTGGRGLRNRLRDLDKRDLSRVVAYI